MKVLSNVLLLLRNGYTPPLYPSTPPPPFSTRIDAGADVTAETDRGFSAIHYAVRARASRLAGSDTESRTNALDALLNNFRALSKGVVNLTSEGAWR